MIQFELDNAHDMHHHWLRDRRFGKRADFTGKTLENLTAKYMDFTGAVFDGAVIRNTDFSSANLTNLSAISTHFDDVDFAGVNLRGANLRKSLFTNCEFIPYEIDLWDVIGNGTQIISLQLGGKHVVYTDELLQIDCKKFELERVRSSSFIEAELLRRFNVDPEAQQQAFDWWTKWGDTILQIIHKNPAESVK